MVRVEYLNEALWGSVKQLSQLRDWSPTIQIVLSHPYSLPTSLGCGVVSNELPSDQQTVTYSDACQSLTLKNLSKPSSMVGKWLVTVCR